MRKWLLSARSSLVPPLMNVSSNASIANDGRRRATSARARPRRERGVRGGTALAIWAACLAGGVGVGVLTDGGPGSAPLSRGGESAGDRSEMRSPAPAGSADEQAGAEDGASPASTSASDTETPSADDGPGDLAAPSTSRPSRHSRPELAELDTPEARAIIEDVLPGLVLPVPLGPELGRSTTTETRSSTTTSWASSSTTETTADPDDAGSGPAVTSLPGLPNR